MPKRIPKPHDVYKRNVLANINYHCTIRGIDKEHQRLIVQCSMPTLNRRLKDPGEFTLNELIRLADKFKIPVWELLKPIDAE